MELSQRMSTQIILHNSQWESSFCLQAKIFPIFTLPSVCTSVLHRSRIKPMVPQRKRLTAESVVVLWVTASHFYCLWQACLLEDGASLAGVRMSLTFLRPETWPHPKQDYWPGGTVQVSKGSFYMQGPFTHNSTGPQQVSEMGGRMWHSLSRGGLSCVGIKTQWSYT
jgi:hypothetical protein